MGPENLYGFKLGGVTGAEPPCIEHTPPPSPSNTLKRGLEWALVGDTPAPLVTVPPEVNPCTLITLTGRLDSGLPPLTPPAPKPVGPQRMLGMSVCFRGEVPMKGAKSFGFTTAAWGGGSPWLTGSINKTGQVCTGGMTGCAKAPGSGLGGKGFGGTLGGPAGGPTVRCTVLMCVLSCFTGSSW